MDKKIKKPLNLDLRWKTKRWFWMVFGFNIMVPIILVLDRILTAKLSPGGSNKDIWNIFSIAFFPLLLLCIFTYYYVSSKKFYVQNSQAIKEKRIGYFEWGLVISFISFCLLLWALVISFLNIEEKNKSILVYIILGADCVLGTTSTALLTFYEFCISFDVFYSRNKTYIIEEYLRRQVSGDLKLKGEEINED